MSSGFTKKGLSSLIKETNKYQNPQGLLDRIMVRLCDEGIKAIKLAYADGWSGASAKSVDKRQVSPTKWEIFAQSEGLLYLEFGAGLQVNSGGGSSMSRMALDKIDTGGAEIVPLGTGANASNPNGWYFSVSPYHTKGTVARHGFADAITAIYASVNTIIEEEMKR